VGLLLNEVDALMMEDTEKTRLLNAFFASVFIAKAGPQESQAERKPAERMIFLKDDCVRDHLSNLNTHKSMGPDGMHAGVLRELADVIAEPLSIIFERSLRTGEVVKEWRKASVTPVFTKGKKEDPGSCRPLSLTSISAKLMEQLLLDVVIKRVEEKKIIGRS